MKNGKERVVVGKLAAGTGVHVQELPQEQAQAQVDEHRVPRSHWIDR